MEAANLVSELWALASVIVIDVVLAGDNAVAVGMAAAGLPKANRGKVILIGIIAATLLRIAFALGATQLMQIVGLTLAGGVLLLWVAWKLWRELRREGRAAEKAGEAALEGGSEANQAPTKTFRQAVLQIVAADLSMSLDNVLAVAGVAREHPVILIIGLVLSVAMMGAAAVIIARLLERHRWIAYVGLVLIAYVALRMVWDGGHEVLPAMGMS
ncbi:MAG: TerC family protein [Alphaproteobacteria bacterium]|nr:TerC family protein [Alphaproteobacteria bacterium]